MCMRGRILGHNERNAQAVVEFALVLPLFVLLVFGAVEFGRAYLRQHLLTNAAREGARVGSLPDSDEQAVVDAVEGFLTDVGLNTGDFSVTVDVVNPDGNDPDSLSGAEQGHRVHVTVANDFEVLSGSIIPGFQGTVGLDATCVFRHE